MTDWKRCPRLKDDGEQCKVTTRLNPETGLCLWHDPTREEERRTMQRKGGHASTEKHARPEGAAPADETPAAPKTLMDAVLWSAWLTHSVVVGDLDTARANAAARLLKEFRQCLERSESRETLEELRERIEKLVKERTAGDGPNLEALP